jgi:hypothetical protein
MKVDILKRSTWLQRTGINNFHSNHVYLQCLLKSLPQLMRSEQSFPSGHLELKCWRVEILFRQRCREKLAVPQSLLQSIYVRNRNFIGAEFLTQSKFISVSMVPVRKSAADDPTKGGALKSNLSGSPTYT